MKNEKWKMKNDIVCAELDLYQFLLSFLLISWIDCVEDMKDEM